MTTVVILIAVLALVGSIAVVVVLRRDVTSLCCEEHGQRHDWDPAFAKPGRARRCKVCGVGGLA